jgi:hypothetical protein
MAPRCPCGRVPCCQGPLVDLEPWPPCRSRPCGIEPPGALGPRLPGTRSPLVPCGIDDQAPSRPWCQNPWTPSDRGLDDSKAPMRTSRRRQLGTFISSATLIPRLDGSLVDPGPKAPSRQRAACGMMPSSPVSQGAQGTSHPARPRYQVAGSSRDARVPWSTGTPDPMAALVFEVPRCSRGLGNSSSMGRQHPGPMLPPAPWWQ